MIEPEIIENITVVNLLGLQEENMSGLPGYFPHFSGTLGGLALYSLPERSSQMMVQ